MIICAAIKLTNKYGMFDMELEEPEELIICGCRHGDCYKTMKNLKEHWFNSTISEGFVNHKGEFLDRKEAFEHIREIGQSNATQRWYWQDTNQTELYSEDLY